MEILWTYLKPYRSWIILALFLAAIAQVLSLYDPVIFGKIIDQYTLNPGNKEEDELIRSVLIWLAIAIAIALAARLAITFKDYVMRMVVQKFGMQIFNDGLRQTLRLPYQEFEDTVIPFDDRVHAQETLEALGYPGEHERASDHENDARS